MKKVKIVRMKIFAGKIAEELLQKIIKEPNMVVKKCRKFLIQYWLEKKGE